LDTHPPVPRHWSWTNAFTNLTNLTKSTNIFFLGLILAASGLISTPVALLLGLIYGLSFVHPYSVDSKKLSAFLLQASVVFLGFGMNLHEVVHAGRSGFAYTALSIMFAMLLGRAIGRLFRVEGIPSLLISAGTAICGGSAIAAVGPVINAGEEEMAVSLGTVFMLNSVALFLFPAVGYALHLSQSQFGLWSALAIHDTSSVVGAAAKYGPQALTIGTTIKLARALWIVPLTFVVAMVKKSKTRFKCPWFILLFCLAAVMNTYFPLFGSMYPKLSALGKTGLTVTLYLIGTGISKSTLKKVGVRPLLQGILLWGIVAITSLEFIRVGWISI
jgi:uncharacterized integral membrane protein (TIGR00698 family)